MWLLLFGLAALAYWELVLCEGAHLGRPVVIGLYDLVADRYDAHIKKFEPEIEADLIGRPLSTALVECEAPHVLDVAAGTGRVARALQRELSFDGRVTQVERASRMLAVGRAQTDPARTSWLKADAGDLPFCDSHFDAVTCLEALEFLPDLRHTLAECVRVLRPGGWLVISHRVGWPGRLILGRSLSRPAFRQLLHDLPLVDIRAERWQVEYDLVWATKRP